MVGIIKSLPRQELWEIRDHRDNTAKDLIKGYTASQISLMDGIDRRTVKTSGRYLPIRVDDWQSMSRFRAGNKNKPYRILYIRLDEIKYIFNKKTGKKLVVEYN